MEQDSPPKSRIYAVAKLAVIIVGCILAYSALVILVIGWQFSRELKEFPKRHLEATQAIERIYSHFHEFGRSPAKVDVERAGQQWQPPERDYQSDPNFKNAMLCLNGSWHMKISSMFAPPSQRGAVDKK